MPESTPDQKWHVSGYTELSKIGSGTQGRVVLARTDNSSHIAAIKYLDSGLLGNPRTQLLFRKEAAVLQRVASPHVARLYQYVEGPQGAAIVMEAVGGSTLRKLLDEQQVLAPEAALAMLKGSLFGLAAAHAVDVVHRDYKPANVIVQPNGQSKLVDFGIAVLTGRGDGLGTPRYMAPEQWNGGPASPETDIYAATCVFFECITGAPPYPDADVQVLGELHRAAPIPYGSLPEALRPLVARGMDKEPGRRYENAVEFVSALESLASDAYGADWEKRGLIALGAAAAALATALPLALFGGTALTQGAAIISGTGGAAGHAAGSVAENAGHLGQAAAEFSRQGILAKVGGAKVATGVAGVGGAAAVTAAVLLWPSGPEVGGISRGSVHAYFTRPGLLVGQPHMPAAHTPFIKLDLTVSPTRVRPGTKVRFTMRFTARTPSGGKYASDGSLKCFGEHTKRKDVIADFSFGIGSDDGGEEEPEPAGSEGNVWLYEAAVVPRSGLPQGGGTPIKTVQKHAQESQPYNMDTCAYLSTWVDIHDFTVPVRNSPPPGSYRLAPTNPPRMVEVTRQGTKVSPEVAGGRTEGTLPELTVLPE
ncbi:hypothetical protein DPM19_15985 [Actinomadura craniellae]|uniref:non-specific serine/threonine protein kinase n=1 Tax=Actinomadura craniellae TaxID=2231787 RepID=A0A365H861_9ACTN|nr:serine/threonine-protein kinase [Actinomadura craniellae]RAY14453.1 hypothetical protein DPM19_15985 [Actinomadura craniellae]